MITRSCFPGLVILLSAAPWCIQERAYSGERSELGAKLARAQEAVRELAREVEFLQEDIITDLAGSKEHTLYRQADSVLGDIVVFQQTLEPAVAPAGRAKRFGQLDEKVHELLKEVRQLGSKQPWLQRAAARVENADDLLHSAMTDLGALASSPRLLDRQARMLANAARQLEQSAEYALAGTPGQALLLAELKKLAKTAAQLDKQADDRSTPEQLKHTFTALTATWSKVVHSMRELPPRQNVFLLRAAGRVEQMHQHLWHSLGIEGERPRLSIRA